MVKRQYSFSIMKIPPAAPLLPCRYCHLDAPNASVNIIGISQTQTQLAATQERNSRAVGKLEESLAGEFLVAAATMVKNYGVVLLFVQPDFSLSQQTEWVGGSVGRFPSVLPPAAGLLSSGCV